MSAHIILESCRSLDRMIATERQVKGSCSHCHAEQSVDLDQLRRRVGGSYSLFNRRCRCALTPGCPGWVRFFYLHGVWRPLWDEGTMLRWYSHKAV
ncbi:hypothetical protein DXH95_03230 [Sphingorhabdus pulchriflava]|uniref:Uncharacterized protein n=1 Tax=Sphingorhabdus pulchriflava TaxID=2292257 RepID=A0A371BGC1_9SPHN|nr:hypothetical protein [Sphingorhabdus pulchriflava]RDV06453.1 hypothetical protein DXH95_03230 [Sphingorhabdus pulchriflava]